MCIWNMDSYFVVLFLVMIAHNVTLFLTIKKGINYLLLFSSFLVTRFEPLVKECFFCQK